MYNRDESFIQMRGANDGNELWIGKDIAVGNSKIEVLMTEIIMM